MLNVRVAAARVVADVSCRGRSLATLMPQFQGKIKQTERGLCQELCYGTLRFQPRLEQILKQLMPRPLKAKDSDVHSLLLVGLYQLLYLRIPAHAAVDETVSATKGLKKPWSRGLVNGVLRNFQRRQAELLALADSDFVGQYAHPEWLIRRLQQAWPEDWQAMLQANNQYPPMTLRVNALRQSRDDYLQRLKELGIAAQPCAFSFQGITLTHAQDVQQLPGFSEGWVSVQDQAAQLAATLLDLQDGQRVLDACAAPGGKTCHILERAPALQQLVAIDQDEGRLQRVAQNLARLGLQAKLICGDAADPQSWWDGEGFDRILLDAPCSASGVIRRHPDIKLLRHDSDIGPLAQLQGEILRAAWSLLKRGGRLVYATCSVLPDENSRQIGVFLAECPDAREIPIDASWGRACDHGRQILPGEAQMDGFYYACLERL